MKRKLFIECNFAFILGIIFLIIGPTVIYLDFLAYGSIWYKVLLGTFIPSIILFYISRIKETRKKLYSVLLVIHIILLLRYFGIYTFGRSGPYTDIKFYNHILRENNYPERLGVFPEVIPEDASDINMRYFRGMLQAKGFFVLKYKASEKHIDDLLKKYEFKSGVGFGEGTNNALLYTSYAYIRDMDEKTIDINYGEKIYIYETDYSNYTTGILILKDVAEVVYFIFIEP